MSQETLIQTCAFTAASKDAINSNFDELYNAAPVGSLTSAHLLVGDSGDVAQDVAITGDVGFTNTGVTSIAGGVTTHKLSAGVAAGYVVARSAAPVAVTGTLDINTGLAAVVSVTISASSDMDGTNLAAVSAVITGSAGHFTAKCWKITAADNGALIAATGAKNINWIAVGTA